MKERSVLMIVAIVGLIGLIVLMQDAAASRKLGGEVGQCYYVNQCRYENHGFGNFVGYNYYFCGGAWSGYSRWVEDDRCVYPAETVRG